MTEVAMVATIDPGVCVG